MTHKYLEYIRYVEIKTIERLGKPSNATNNENSQRDELDWSLGRRDAASPSMSAVPIIYEGTPTMNTPQSGSEPFSDPRASPTATLVPPPRPELRHKTSYRFFNARIMRVCEQHVDKAPARGLFDTGSDENFLSMRFLNINGLGDVSLTNLDRERTIDSLQGMTTTVRYKAKVHWYMEDSAKEHVTEFLVVEDDRFDLLVGNDFIEQNDIFKRKGQSSPVFLVTLAAQKSKHKKDSGTSGWSFTPLPPSTNITHTPSTPTYTTNMNICTPHRYHTLSRVQTNTHTPPDPKSLSAKFRQQNSTRIPANMLHILNQRGPGGPGSLLGTGTTSHHARTASVGGTTASSTMTGGESASPLAEDDGDGSGVPVPVLPGAVSGGGVIRDPRGTGESL